MNTELNTPLPINTKVAAILVNWRQPAHTLTAVKALDAQSLRPQIIVVDNGSGDDSVEILTLNLPKDALLVLRDTNGGFGAGCNAGIEKAISMGMDYIWVINNDAQPERQCLELMVRKALADPLTGIVGARLMDPSGSLPDHAGWIMNKWTFASRYSSSEKELNLAKYSWISGTSMLLSIQAVRRVGMYSPKFFMYWEDADFCARLKSAGFQFRVELDAIVQHTPGTSSNMLQLQRFKWHIDSQISYVVRNYEYKQYGILLIYTRSILKSVISFNGQRLRMTIKSLLS